MAGGTMQFAGKASARLLHHSQEISMPSQPIALCRLEHEGTVYNYGDLVPSEVAEANPGGVGEPPMTTQDVESMSPEEMMAYIKRQNGLSDA